MNKSVRESRVSGGIYAWCTCLLKMPLINVSLSLMHDKTV